MRVVLAWLLLVLAEVAAAQSAAASDRGVMLFTGSATHSGASGASATVINVEFGVEKRIVGWVEYNTNNCQPIDSGQWTTLTAPKHGKLRYQIQNETVTSGPCAGASWPFNFSYYTWNDSSTSEVTDTFSMEWFTADGHYADSYDMEADLTKPALKILNPYALGVNGLSDIEISTVANVLYSASGGVATGMACDNTAAAIAVVKTPSSSAVTFTSAGAASLATYQPAFQTQAPHSGGSSSSLSVTPTQVGSLYYAVALLESNSCASGWPTTPIRVTALQSDAGAKTLQATLKVAPVPVLLLHGLWGDANSLTAYYDSLKTYAPWKSFPQLVIRTSYNGNIRFDSSATQSTLSGNVNTVLSTLQKLGLVGGRVDLVAHSMGGLVLRAFSTQSGYQSVVNRNQGAFHTIVTLDTPEAGSLMATYLLAHQKDTLKATFSSDWQAYTLWMAYCKSSSITISACFANDKKQVLAGAVQSLQPTDKGLLALPNPNIKNSIWAGVTATDGSTNSFVELSALIRATYSKKSDAPTIASILGGVNDDVVALTSQKSGKPLGCVTFPNLAHTPLFDFSGNAVTGAAKAVDQTRGWLFATNGVKTCAPQVATAAVAAQLALSPLRVTAPAEAILAEGVQLSGAASGVKSVSVTQQAMDGRDSVSDTVSPTLLAGGGFKAQTTARMIGRTRFKVVAEFADKSFAFESVDINVSVDPRSLGELRADREFDSLDGLRQGDSYQLNPTVTVKGLAEPVELGSLAVYTVIGDTLGAVPVTVDANGFVHAVAPGAAKIGVSYLGRSTQLRVLVR